MLSRLLHMAEHPRSLFPGAPRGVINNVGDWVRERAGSTSLDSRSGPKDLMELACAAELISMPRATEALSGAVVRVDRLMPIAASARYCLSGARIIGEEGVVISPDNRVIAESTYVDTAGGIASHGIFRRRRFPRAKALIGWYATLCYPSGFAYYHWLTECLPRLALLGAHVGQLDGIFVPSRLEASQRDSLRAYGVHDEQLLMLEMGSHFAPEHLILPGYCAGRNIPTWVSPFLRRIVGKTTGKADQRIYVSRGDAPKRRVVNEAELLPVLESFGIECVRARDLSFLDQIQLFDQAQLVVGPHGAGLTNALYCRPGAHMLELLPAPSVEPGCFHSVAGAAQMNYWCMHGQRRDDSVVDDIHADMAIDPELLTRALQRVVGSL